MGRDLINRLLEKVPELNDGFEGRKEMYYSDDGDYVIWGIGMMPCIIELFDDFENNRSVLERVFAFFEEMANSEEKTRDLLLYAVLENLGYSKIVLEKSKLLMGEKTLEDSRRVEAFWEGYEEYSKRHNVLK